MAILVVLKAVAAVKENFRQEYVIDFVKGRGTDDIVSHKHDQSGRVWSRRRYG